MSTTRTAAPVWINNNGIGTCGAHAGYYLRAAIEARPEQVVHDTPIETWFRDDAPESLCETCRCSPFTGQQAVSEEKSELGSGLDRRGAVLQALGGVE